MLRLIHFPAPFSSGSRRHCLAAPSLIPILQLILPARVAEEIPMFERLEQIAARYEELGREMASDEVVNDHERYQKIAKQHRDLGAGGR